MATLHGGTLRSLSAIKPGKKLRLAGHEQFPGAVHCGKTQAERFYSFIIKAIGVPAFWRLLFAAVFHWQALHTCFKAVQCAQRLHAFMQAFAPD
ncbi:hypothetical protein [Comamonas aquatilis]|uniref:hypothetical protein n=1 Tax=Comamonas aquatilis TaxID=1778406 RepID=UPI0039EF19B2